jgi:hypothetical protein
MEPEEARIAAHVCSDGWMITYVEKESLQIVNGRRYHRNRRRYEVGYCNTNKKLLEEFSKDVLGVYKITVRRRKSTDLIFKSKRVYSRIKELGGGNTLGWCIGNEILKSKKTVKIFWLGTFFDDEGTVDKTNFVARVKSMNSAGLNQARCLMNTIDVPSRITGPNCDDSWYLTVSRRDLIKFQKTIGFNHPEKKLLLDKILSGSKENGIPVLAL